MIKHFVEFEGRQNAAKRDEIKVTLNKRRVFVLNPKAQAMLGHPEAVKLFFDEGRKVIGMKAADPSLPNAFRLRQVSMSRHRTTTAASFCAHYGIQVDGTVKFLNPEMDGDMLTLDITKVVNVTRGVR